MIIEIHSFKSFIATTVALAAMIMLSGCADSERPTGGMLSLFYDDLPLEDWSEVPEPKEPKVNLVKFDHDVVFFSSEDSLSPRETERLGAFLKRSGVGYSESVYVVGSRQGAETKRAASREKMVLRYLEQRGLLAEVLPDVYTEEPISAGSVKVIVRRYEVTLPGCPDWSGRPAWSYNNMAHSNFGCATAVNLGLMVADPGDLAAGRDPGPADGDFAAGSIQRYRKNETTEIVPEDVGTIDSQQ